MSEEKIQTWPFDLDELEKGHWIPPEACEERVNCPRASKDYGLKLLALQGLLERQWLHEREEVITTQSEKDGIRIVDDNASIDVNQERFDRARRAQRRALRRVSGVDRAKLPSDERRDAQEKQVRTMTAYIVNGQRAYREAARLEAHKRSTPLLGKDDD